MGTTTYLINSRRLAKAFAPEPSAPALARGCKGAACPAFAICQGRCATKHTQPRVHPDGGVWIDPIA
jgi:hypothetical protein